MNPARYPRFLGVALLVWVGIVLLCAFVIICVHTGTIWPWTKIVHEDGRHTLIGTILYFEHATRELPIDVILGVAIGGCVFFAFPSAPGDHRAEQAASSRQVLTLALTTVIVLAIILVGAAAKGGMSLVLDELLQKRTRDGAPLEFGSHWRYHLLSRIAMMLCSVGVAGALRMLSGEQRVNARRGLVIAAGSIGIYIALTIVFSRGRLFELEQPFRDPQYLGHQAREVLTHALVTVPIAWGVCMLMLSNWKPAVPANSTSRILPLSPTIAGMIIVGAAGILLATYVCVAALMAGAASRGQTTDPVTLIFPHFFEHSFTYVLVSVVAALIYAVAANSTVRPPSFTRQ